MARIPTRAEDDRLLAMLALRCRGVTLRSIGARFGISYVGVNKATQAVRQADYAQSGEPASVLDRAYWQEGRW